MKITSLPMVYVLTTEDLKYTKIGMTKNLKSRISNLQSGCPFKLRLQITAHTNRAVEFESMLHERFSASRLNGEWFNLSDSEFDALCDEIESENRRIKAEVRGVAYQVV